MHYCLFIFRRDLRLEDNTGLNAALKSGLPVIPLFILDPRQLNPHPYRSVNGMQFMFESLRELDGDLRSKGSRLHLCYGEAQNVLDALLESGDITSVYLNRDYTPFSTQRDEALFAICKNRGVTFALSHDALLHEPQSSKKPDGGPYTVFTPFFKKNSKTESQKPVTYSGGRFASVTLPFQREIHAFTEILPTSNSHIFRSGGRKEALVLLDKKVRSLTEYNILRDIPSVQGTSGLSPHHKFGTCSIRESYWAAKTHLPADNRFISELYWRDFFTTVGYFFPHVYQKSFQSRFEKLEWDDNPKGFERWCAGETGFPIVDAGMRELNETGYMHNRVRMITASFLVKDLHINWQEGEKYFAQKLIDYDPAVNNGSWQWSASTGCDAQPYFRIFNPWLQQAKFDPEATYIKQWIPELRNVSVKDINGRVEAETPIHGYPAPMLEHAFEKKITEDRYGKLAK